MAKFRNLVVLHHFQKFGSINIFNGALRVYAYKVNVWVGEILSSQMVKIVSACKQQRKYKTFSIMSDVRYRIF